MFESDSDKVGAGDSDSIVNDARSHQSALIVTEVVVAWVVKVKLLMFTPSS